MKKEIRVIRHYPTYNEERFAEGESYLLRIHDDIADIRHGFIRLGFHLAEIKKCLYYEAAGYFDFYKFCEVNYGLEATTVKRYIEVWRAFAEYYSKSNSRKMWIDEKYVDYTYSQLVEMLPLDDKQRKQILPVMTIKEIRQKKKEMKAKKCDVAPQPMLIEPPAEPSVETEPEEYPDIEKCDVAPGIEKIPEEPIIRNAFVSLGADAETFEIIQNDRDKLDSVFEIEETIVDNIIDRNYNAAYENCLEMIQYLWILSKE